MNRNLIIRAELANPPSSVSAFRDLTMYPSIRHEADVLIEVEPEAIDIYYRWMKPRGLLDYVQQFVRPLEETGVAIDVLKRRPKTLLVERIILENVHPLLRELSVLFTK